MTGLMTGKRGLIMGLANDRSLAWGIAQKLAEQGAELAFSYQGEALEKRVRPLAEQLGADFLIDCDVADMAALDAARVVSGCADSNGQSGGGLTALMRHTVAALLNASNPDVDPASPFDTTAEVIAAFQAAFDSGSYTTQKDLFEASNEAGCPLN